jgi:hypothetical protein
VTLVQIQGQPRKIIPRCTCTCYGCPCLAGCTCYNVLPMPGWLRVCLSAYYKRLLPSGWLHLLYLVACAWLVACVPVYASSYYTWLPVSGCTYYNWLPVPGWLPAYLLEVFARALTTNGCLCLAGCTYYLRLAGCKGIYQREHLL